ncbi:NAD(P)/FAD-dependent oxidoreductase [Thermaurantiacus sp.]
MTSRRRSAADVLVAGGGLAGAATATWLARAGRQVRLLERDECPQHRICGEFLSWEAQAALADLGVDLAALGALTIRHVRLVAGAKAVTSPLGFTGKSVTRRRLDAALLERAAAAGVEVMRGCQVRALAPDGALMTSLGPMAAPVTVVATGKHALRGAFRSHAGTLDHQLGFKNYFRLRPAMREALADHVELILFEGGYAGLQLVEQHMANLCLLVSAERYQAAGGRYESLLASLCAQSPHLRARLDGASPLLDRPLAISRVPYGYVWRPRPDAPAMRLPVGDQATVIPSFTGDGMGLSLHGARLAAQAILDGQGAPAYARALLRDAAPAVARATFLQKFVGEGPVRQRGLVTLAGIVPGLLTLSARLTRLRPEAVAAVAAGRPNRIGSFA